MNILTRRDPTRLGLALREPNKSVKLTTKPRQERSATLPGPLLVEIGRGPRARDIGEGLSRSGSAHGEVNERRSPATTAEKRPKSRGHLIAVKWPTACTWRVLIEGGDLTQSCGALRRGRRQS